MCATSNDNQGFFSLQRFLDALKLFAEYVESYSNEKEEDPEGSHGEAGIPISLVSLITPVMCILGAWHVNVLMSQSHSHGCVIAPKGAVCVIAKPHAKLQTSCCAILS